MQFGTLQGNADATGELASVVQQSLTSANELQSRINTLGAMPSLEHNILLSSGILENVVRLHSINVLNHGSVLRLLSNGGPEQGGPSKGVLQAISQAAEKMLNDTRAVHEHVLQLQIAAQRSGKTPTASNSTIKPLQTPPSYHQPTVESSEDDQEAVLPSEESKSGLSDPGVRKIMGAKTRRKAGHQSSSSQPSNTTIPMGKGPPDTSVMSKSVGKRELDLEDIPTTQALLKRTRLTPKTTIGDKRKSDVSMHDADETDARRLPHKRICSDAGESISLQADQGQQEFASQNVFMEQYEDLSQEVDAAMERYSARKEQERKHALGIVDKRKRESGDSFIVELGVQDDSVSANGRSSEKRARKKKKHKKSSLGPEDGIQ